MKTGLNFHGPQEGRVQEGSKWSTGRWFGPHPLSSGNWNGDQIYSHNLTCPFFVHVGSEIYSVWISSHDMFCILESPNNCRGPMSWNMFLGALQMTMMTRQLCIFWFSSLCTWHGSVRFLGMSDYSHAICRYYSFSFVTYFAPLFRWFWGVTV